MSQRPPNNKKDNPRKSSINLQARMPEPSEVTDKTTDQMPFTPVPQILKNESRPKEVPESTDDILYMVLWHCHLLYGSLQEVTLSLGGGPNAQRNIDKAFAERSQRLEQNIHRLLDQAVQDGIIDINHRNFILTNLGVIYADVVRFTQEYDQTKGVNPHLYFGNNHDRILYSCMHAMQQVKLNKDWQNMKFYRIDHPANRGPQFFRQKDDYTGRFLGDSKRRQGQGPERPGGAKL